MKIELGKVFKHIGDVIQVKQPFKDFDGEVEIAPGTYQIIEKTPDGIDLYNLYTTELETLYEYQDSDKVTIITTPPQEKLELLLEAYTKVVIELLADGWTEIENPKPNDMDISPYMQRVVIVRKLLDGFSIKEQ